MGSYDRHARYYDALYGAMGHDAQRDVDTLFELLRDRGINPTSVLDVACGTGRHTAVLADRLRTVVGTDLSEDMLAVARDRAPDVTFLQADFRRFDLGRRFDVVACLFSSVGHVRDADELGQAIRAMAGHVDEGGALVVEAWLTPDDADPAGRRDATVVPVGDGHVARLSRSQVDGTVIVLEYVWAVATSDEVHSEIERLELPLFTREQYLAAVESAGLTGEWVAPGPFVTGRPVLMGTRPGAGA